MPTKGTWYRKDNFIHAESQPEGLSEYVNKLIERDRGKKSPEATPPVKVPHIEKILGSKKGDGLHTCKKCGSQLMYYKAKCKLCK